MSVAISVQHFGPIETGSVALRPLTIFIGPNNTGKSYLAMLTYAANHRVPFGGIRYRYLGHTPPFYYSYPHRDLKITKETERFLREWRRAGRLESGTLPPPVAEQLEAVIVDSLERYGSSLAAEIERCFGRELGELVRNNATEHRENWIEIRHGNPRWAIRLHTARGRDGAELTTAPNVRQAFRQATAAQRLRSQRGPTLQALPPELLWESLVELTLDACFSEFPKLAYYLPAARSGILQSHKLLASVIVSRSPLAGIEDMQVPKLTGVLSDFISHLLQLDSRRKTSLASIAEYLEADALKGDVRIRGGRPAYPEIMYEAGSGKYQLHATSSMVSELAPVVLFLRHLVDPAEMLVIEEPESHLHPSVQRKFARAIARLANAGVTTVLTTHSDYFVTQINNLILAANLKPHERARAGYAAEECLDVSRVAAYLFKPTGEEHGTAVKRMRLSRTRAIPQSEFVKTAEALYAETVALERSVVSAD